MVQADSKQYTIDGPSKVKAVRYQWVRQGQISIPPMDQAGSKQYTTDGPGSVKTVYHRWARQGRNNITPMGQAMSKQYTADGLGRVKTVYQRCTVLTLPGPSVVYCFGPALSVVYCFDLAWPITRILVWPCLVHRWYYPLLLFGGLVGQHSIFNWTFGWSFNLISFCTKWNCALFGKR